MDDWEYLPLSWLSQIDYCPRRAALLLNERLWAESTDTAKGRSEHERVHSRRIERRGDNLKLYEFTVFSEQMQLLGKCDCIEAVRDESGCRIPAAEFPVRLYPVEYKHGSVRDETEYQIQLCAQAICLEEMFHTTIPEGAIFFISSHRRVPIALDEALRKKTRETAENLWNIRHRLKVPAAQYSAKCRRCSLKELCMPKVQASAKKYLSQLRREARGSIEEDEE